MASGRTRVLHVITHLGLGGAQDNTLTTVRSLDRHNYEVDLASAPGGAWERRARAYADTFVPLEHMVRSFRRPWSDIRTLLDLVRVLRNGDYDVVHTHSAKAGLLGRVAGRLAGVPMIVHTLHGFHGYRFLDRALFFALEGLGALFCDRIITVSEINRKDAISLGLFPPRKAVTIHSGIDVASYVDMRVDRGAKMAELGLPATSPVIGTVGRLAVQKAPLDLVAAAHRVIDRVPEARFIIAGDGPLHSAVKRAIGAEERIRLLGHREDVGELLQVMDVFVVSSLWEGIGRALTEAMAAGRPVIATRVSGVPELVVDGETGLLVPPGQPGELAKAILRLLKDNHLASRLAEQGQRKVMREFDARTMVTEIAALYEGFLANRGLR